MKKAIYRLLLLLVSSIGIATIGCSDTAGSNNESGNLTNDLRNNTNSKSESKADSSTSEQPASTGTTHASADVSANAPDAKEEVADSKDKTKDDAADKPKTPAYVTIQVVQGPKEGDLDVYVTNTSDKDITGCILWPFEGIQIKLPPLIQPGQVAMCGLGGDIPEEVTFTSDQFKEVKCDFPEPLEDLDVSRFDWAEVEVPSTDKQPDDDKDDVPQE